MIEIYAVPGFIIVAAFTAVLRIVFGFDKSLVYVLMAVDTAVPDLPETPLLLLFMTGDAGCCQVRSLQRKNPGIMHLQGKGGACKSFGSMAVRTAPHQSACCELTIMVIDMAVGALLMFYRIGDVGLVA